MAAHEVEVWIDTGFNGDLVLPRQQIDDLALPQLGTVKAILADGSEIALKRYACLIDWYSPALATTSRSRSSPNPMLGLDCSWAAQSICRTGQSTLIRW
jgi:predicted aspartyl protease